MWLIGLIAGVIIGGLSGSESMTFFGGTLGWFRELCIVR